MPSPLDIDESELQADPAKVNPFAAQMASKAASPTPATQVGGSASPAAVVTPPPQPVAPPDSSGLSREELLRQAAEAPATSFKLPESIAVNEAAPQISVPGDIVTPPQSPAVDLSPSISSPQTSASTPSVPVPPVAPGSAPQATQNLQMPAAPAVVQPTPGSIPFASSDLPPALGRVEPPKIPVFTPEPEVPSIPVLPPPTEMPSAFVSTDRAAVPTIASDPSLALAEESVQDVTDTGLIRPPIDPKPDPILAPPPAMANGVLPLAGQPVRRGISGGVIALIFVLLVLGGSGLGYVLASMGREVPIFYPLVSGLPTGGANANARAQAYLAARTRYTLSGQVTLTQQKVAEASPSASPSPSGSTQTGGSDDAVQLVSIRADYGPAEFSEKGAKFLAKVTTTINDLPQNVTAGLRVAVERADDQPSESASASPSTTPSGVPQFTDEPSPSPTPSDDPVTPETGGGTLFAYINDVEQAEAQVAVSVQDVQRTIVAPVFVPIPLETILEVSETPIASEKLTGNNTTATGYVFTGNPEQLAAYFPVNTVVSAVQTAVQYEWKTNKPIDAQLSATLRYKEKNYQFYVRYTVSAFDAQIDTVNTPEVGRVVSANEGSAAKGIGSFVGGFGMFLGGVPSDYTSTELEAEEVAKAAFPITPSGKGITQVVPAITSSPPPAPQPADTAAKARDAQRLKDLSDIALALAEYKKLKGAYPRSTGTYLEQSGTIQALLSALLPGYLTKLPIDPRSDVYWYAYQSDGLTYRLTAPAEDFATQGAIKATDTFYYLEVVGK